MIFNPPSPPPPFAEILDPPHHHITMEWNGAQGVDQAGAQVQTGQDPIIEHMYVTMETGSVVNMYGLVAMVLLV